MFPASVAMSRTKEMSFGHSVIADFLVGVGAMLVDCGCKKSRALQVSWHHMYYHRQNQHQR